MKLALYTIDLSRAEVALCRKAAPCWGDVPGVAVGLNKMKKPEWTRVMMSLDAYTYKPKPDRKEAQALAVKIYAATENGRGCEVTEVVEPDPVPVPVAKQDVQRSLF